jgi:hypothetical protein
MDSDMGRWEKSFGESRSRSVVIKCEDLYTVMYIALFGSGLGNVPDRHCSRRIGTPHLERVLSSGYYFGIHIFAQASNLVYR